MNVLLISPDGMLGRAWSALLANRGVPHRSVSYPTIDLTQPATVGASVGDDVTHVINCSAYTDVDGAETHEDVAMSINGTGVGLLAERCRDVGAMLVHYSTDYVFDGEATDPYPVDHARAPINAYGRTKAVGEEAIEASGVEHLIIRTSWLYAPWGKNFVLTMRRLSRERDRLTVVDDTRGRPTSAEYLAMRSLALLQAGGSGLQHVTDGGECSWYHFTCEIVRILGNRCQVEPCTSDAFPQVAKRPKYSVLDLSKTEALIGPSRPWQDNVADALAAVEGGDR